MKRPRLEQYLMELILLALCVVFALTAPGFMRTRNLLNVMRNVALQGMIAFSMTAVIISGEIDLSVGSAVAFAGVIMAWLTQWFTSFGLPLAVGIPIAVILTLVASSVVGWTIAYMRNAFSVPTFITSLAYLTMLSGFANLITGGFPITSFPRWFNTLGGGSFLSVPVPALFLIVVFAAFEFIMNHTSFGRSIYAVGGNAEAARLNGINVKRVKYVLLSLTGCLAGVTGILVASQIMAGTPTVGRGWELQIISAVIIGGASLAGGAGRIRGTLIGIFFLGVIINGMTLLNISQYWQLVVRGALILIAILINNLRGLTGATRT
ncbi:MAG: ABC transporter permease [Spirochaetaceae bacterium]|nr:MAG: ABC transporter permease [Spirochaetaceae bacterium]